MKLKLKSMKFIFLILLPFLLFSQTWKDDSLIVRQILDTNGMNTIQVEEVSKKGSNGRIISLALTNFIEYHILPSCVGMLTYLEYLTIGGTNIKNLVA